LRDAIAASRERLRIQSDLERLARDWDHAGRGDGYLLRDERLQAVRATLGRVTTGERLGGLGGEYYDASVALEGRIVAAARRNRRRLWTAVASVVALLSGLLVFVGVQYNIATEQTDLADSRGLAAQANARADGRPDLAMLLAVQAWRTADTIDARSAALTMVNRIEGFDAQLRSPNDGVITAIAVSPTNPLLAVGGSDRAIRLWDLSTRRPRGEPLVLPESRQTGGTGVSSLAFSPDGSRVAAVYSAGAIVVWPLAIGSGPPIHILKPQLGQATKIGFSADGRLVAATGSNGTIALWDASSGDPVARLEAAATGETSFAFPDADTLVAFTRPNEGEGTPALTRWSLRDESRISSLPVLLSEGIDSTISPDGHTLVTWGHNGLATWDATNGQQLAHQDRPEIYVNTDLIVDPLGTRLAVIAESAQVELFDLPSLQPSAVQPPRIYGTSFAFSTDSQTLIVGGSGLTSLWSLEHPRQLSTSLGSTPSPPTVGPSPPEPSTSDLLSVAIEIDGGHRKDMVVSTSSGDPSRMISTGQGTLRMWKLPDQRTAQEVPIGKDLSAVAVSANGNEVAMVRDDNKLQVWYVGDPALSTGFTLDGPTGLARDTSGPSVRLAIQGTNSLAVSADGTMVATGGGTNDERIRLWDPRQGAQWGPEVRPGDEAVQALAFSLHGDLLASSGHSGAISLWRVVPADDGTKRLEPLNADRKLVGHTGPVNSITFSPDGKRVLSGGDDDTVRQWDVTTSQAIGQPIVAATEPEAVAFTSDGETIAAGVDGGIQLWDAATGQPLGDDHVTDTKIRDVAFNANGQFLATIDESGEVVMWDSILWSNDRAAVSERLCAVASRNLTQGEWNQFLPQRPYESTCPQWPPGT
jgi:WD40 repeat protein